MEHIANNADHHALRLFDEFEHFKPDSIATSLGLKACSNLSDYKKGKAIIDRNIENVRKQHVSSSTL